MLVYTISRNALGDGQDHRYTDGNERDHFRVRGDDRNYVVKKESR